MHNLGGTACDQGPAQVQEQRGGPGQAGHHHSGPGKLLHDGHWERDGGGSSGKITHET